MNVGHGARGLSLLLTVGVLLAGCTRSESEIAVDNWCSALADGRAAVERMDDATSDSDDEFYTPTEALDEAIEDMTQAIQDDRLPVDQANAAAEVRNAFRTFSEGSPLDDERGRELEQAIDAVRNQPECPTV